MTISAIDLLSQRVATTVASYATLDRARLKDSLIRPSGAAKFTSAQADAFVAQYELRHQLSNVPLNGFSAAVFLDIQTRKHVIAMRGTEMNGLGQIILDGLVTDGLSIGGNGFANNQAVEMIRYYKRLTTGGGAVVQYTEQEKWQLFAVKNSLLVPLTSSIPLLSERLASEFLTFKLDLASDKGISPPAGSPSASVLSPTERVDVTGHSLGGHLAMLFARFFPANVDQVVTLNAPGFFPQGNLALTALGFPPPNDSSITRIEADGDGISEIGTIWPGYRILLAQENAPGPIAALSSNHSSVNGNDALSLMSLMAKLDPRFANDAVAASQLLGGASNIVASTYERTLDAIRRTVLGPSAVGTVVGDRNALYINIDALTKMDAFKALAGRVTLSSAAGISSLPTQARTDFGTFLTLLNLSPVLIKANSPTNATAVESAFATGWSALYVDWLADKTAIGSGKLAENYTDTYLQDRQAMLQWVMVGNIDNLQNASDGYIGIQGKGVTSFNQRFIDLTSGIRTQVYTNRSTPTTAPNAYVTFGDASSNAFSGDTEKDRLYGGAGNDTLNGLGGADYLEGNAGSDRLLGGDGADTLLGGTGNDDLDGELGNDLLQGGAGLDTYNFNANWGHDVVEDSDGSGAIVVAGLGTLTGSGANKVAANVWQTADKKVNYTLVASSASRSDLYISFSDRAGVITIRNWSDTQRLGITLGTTPAPAPPPASNNYIGDYIKQTSDNRYVFNGDNYASAGAQAGAADLITGSASADQMSGLGGNDALAGMGGDDRIDGGIGSDLLLGGAGSDTILGGDGRDFIFAAGAGGLTYPSSPATPQQGAESQAVVARGFSWVVYEGGTDGNGIQVQYTKGADASWVANDAGNLVDGGAGNDDIHGGPGQDTVYGGADDDNIDGLGQADILFGDDGNDTISGDGVALAGYWSTIPGDQYGDDLIVGGAGNDSLTGQGGADQIYGGIGNDHLWGDDIDPRFTPYARHGADYLNGGDGDDQLTGGGAGDMLVGGEGNDDLFGDWSPDKLPGEQHGSDVLDGGIGADYLEGGGKDDRLYGGAGDDMLWGDAARPGLAAADTGTDELDGGEGNDVLVGGGKADMLYGGGGNDALSGDGASTSADDQGDDLLDGGFGNDKLEGGGGNDTLVGGAGTDVLLGGDGDDTYRVSVDDIPLDSAGLAEYIDDSLGVNTVSLQGLSPEAMSILAVGNGNLQLSAANGNTLVVIGGVAGSVASYQFDGMNPLRSDELIGRYSPSAVIATGPDGKQRAVGGKNNDQMATTARGAVLSGGRGDDTLSGSGGNNTYRYEVGDGLDTVIDTSQKVDGSGVALVNRISFGDGILASELRLSNVAGSGGFRIAVGGDTNAGIVIGGYDASGATTGTPIDRFDFADGTSLNYQQLVALGFDGTDAAETLVGTSVGDRLRGGRGNDTLAGSLGGDTYQWTPGDGSDTIDDTDTSTLVNDKLRLTGVAASDLTLLRNGDRLLVRHNPSNEMVSVLGHFEGRGIEQIELDGGIVWDRAQIASRLSSALTEGDDYYTGTTGNDNIAGLGGNDVISGGGGPGSDYINGGAGNDSITTYRGNDTLIGGLGNDTLDSGDGIDLMSGGEGNDLLFSSAGDDTLDGGGGSDTLMAGDGNDTLIDGEDMSGNRGSDTYRLTQWQQARIDENPTQPVTDVDTLVLPVASTDVVVGLGYNSANSSYDDLNLQAAGKSDAITVQNFFSVQGGNNTVESFRFSDGVTWSAADVIARAPANATSDRSESVMGFRWNDVIDLKGGNDSAQGRLGNDLIYGGAGDDTIYGSEGADTLDGGTGRDVLYGDYSYSSANEGADSLIGGAGDDTLYGGGGTDTLDGGSGADSLWGGGGDDVYAISLDSRSDNVWESSGNDRIRLASGIVQADVALFRDGHDLVVTVRQTAAQTRIVRHYFDASQALERIDFADGTFWDAAAILARTAAGTANAMTATTANDAYTVDNVGDTIAEPVDGGVDTVYSSVSYTLPSNVERLTLTGFVGLNAIGNELDNLIVGNAGNNRLDGKAGADTLQGGQGDDVYIASTPEGDVVIEAPNAGIDTVVTNYDFTLPDNVENLVAQNSNHNFRLVGNALDNEISSNGMFAAVINGGAGADTMYAAAAGSTYYVDNAGDVILGKEGNVATVFDWTLAAGWYDLALLPGAVNGTGNAMSNRLFGNGSSRLVGLGGNDSLYGGRWDAGRDIGVAGSYGESGVDTLIGGLGDDLYQVHVNGAARDVVVEMAGEGRDKVVVSGTTGSYTVSEFANIEDMQLDSSAGDSTLVGDAGDNWLQGNLGRNLIDGGAGNDRIASNSYKGYFFNTGDTLLGGSGNDTLTSFSGFDVMDGGTGNDTYEFLYGASGRVRFGAGSGTDIVSANQAMSSSVVELKAGTQGSDLRLTRNGSNLVIGLQSAPDTLTWYGYFADDTSYQLGRNFGWLELSPMVQLTATQVATRVQSGNSNAATAGDDLLLGGAGADSLSGVGGADQLVGGDGNDTLAGGAGDDVLHGGAGNDTYRFNLGDGADWIYEESGFDTLVFGPGIAPAAVVTRGYGYAMTLVIATQVDQIYVPRTVDEVRFADGTVWSAAMLAQLAALVGTSGNDVMNGDGSDIAHSMRGLAGNDTMFGGAGNDTLDGGSGIDSMAGVGGDDLYIVDTTSDAVIEDPGYGIDTVSASISYTLGANVENLSLTGTTNLSGAGNTLDNVLTGNAGNNSLSGSSGNDTLDGGVGVDTMAGGSGDDVYLVDVTGDIVSEEAGAGIDTVRASVNWTMSANVENLILTGTANLSGTGNTLDNVLTGNAANNSLSASSGNDTLDGGGGVDTMAGGTGDDVYVVDVSGDVVSEEAGAGIDTVRASVSWTTSANVENLVLLGSALNGTGNTSANSIAGNAGNNVLDGAAGNDTLAGGAGNDTYVVDSSADVIVEAAGEGVDTVSATATYTLAANVEHLALLGTAAINGTGNTLANVITGNAGTNVLSGDTGNDQLSGGTGNDTLNGGAGNDTMVGGAGDDILMGNGGSFVANPGPDSSDTYDGGAGNDTLLDEEISDGDVYLLSLGGGADQVNDHGGIRDRIEVASGLAPEQVLVGKLGNGLVISIKGSSDTLTVNNFFSGDSVGPRAVEEVRFADGTVWNQVSIVARAAGLLPVLEKSGVVAAGSAISLQLGANPASGTGIASTLSATLQMTSGQTVPGWLSFNAATRRLVGTPAPADVGVLDMRLVVQAAAGSEGADQTFRLVVVPQGFNPLNYIASYGDLRAAFGTDGAAGAAHYVQRGMAEGRTVTFNALSYIASNLDLIGAFGLNTEAAATHYLANGHAEGRQLNFDALRYIASNPDLIASFGLNTEAATAHYIANGHAEGRQNNFDALRYIASNIDLINAFGANTAAATQHFIGSGYLEGRSTTAFDPAVYLQNYADLRAAYGTDLTAATLHYINVGRTEGRRITPLGITPQRIERPALDATKLAAGMDSFITTWPIDTDHGASSSPQLIDANALRRTADAVPRLGSDWSSDSWTVRRPYQAAEIRLVGDLMMMDTQAQALVGAMAGFATAAGGVGSLAQRSTTVQPVDFASNALA